mgnify:CR=1 FL=1
MSLTHKFMVKGGFGFNQIIASDNLIEWHRKETEKHQMEKDPVLRAYNNIKLNVNPNILPANPLSEADMKDIEAFPFSQINDLAPPANHLKQLLEIESKLAMEERSVQSTDVSAKERELLAKLFSTNPTQTADFVKYLKGEVKSF